MPIAYELAKQISAKFGYVNTKNEVCNFDIKPGDKVIIVGDDIYSGESIKKTIQIISKIGAKVESPILTIGNFSGTKTIFDLDIVSVISEEGALYEENICPMCINGSKAVLPRPNWKKLLE